MHAMGTSPRCNVASKPCVISLTRIGSPLLWSQRLFWLSQTALRPIPPIFWQERHRCVPMVSLSHSVEQLPRLRWGSAPATIVRILNPVLDLISLLHRQLRKDTRDPQGPLDHRTHLKDPQGPRVGLRVDPRVDPLAGPRVDLRVDPLAGHRVDLQADPQVAIRGAAVVAAVEATTMAMMPTSLAARLQTLRVDLQPTGIMEARL